MATDLSPWSKWTTTHALAFKPTLVFQIKNPINGLDAVYMGDSSGNIYLIDGADDQDGGTNDITSFRVSSLINTDLIRDSRRRANPKEELSDLRFSMDYVKDNAAHTVSVTFLSAGAEVFDTTKTLSIPAKVGTIYYGGAIHYGGPYHYGFQFNDRLYRQWFEGEEGSNYFQLKTSITGSSPFRVEEIGFTAKETS